MVIQTLKFKKVFAITFVLILLVSLLGGCNVTPDSTLSSEPSAQSSENKTHTQSAEVEIPEGMLLPFNESGKLIWNISELKDTNIEYLKERTEGYTFTSNLTEEKNAQAFTTQMNDIQWELVGAIKEGLVSSETLFTEFNLGTEVYRITMSMSDQFHLAFLSKSADCGLLWFRLNINSDRDVYYYSLYKIDMNSFQKLEQLFESFEKEKDFLSGKPVLYLYPQNEVDVSVKLSFKGKLTVTYPAYNDGWNVRAFPDGRLVNNADGLEYSYLFWEGFPDKSKWWDLSEGYCIAGADTVLFLQKKLSELGLTPKEYNEFIVYWLPQMQDNPYNLITFQWEKYEELAPLAITPKPDSVLRIFMVFAPLEKPIDIKTPEKRTTFVRNGFTAVEWGASKIEINK